MTAPAPNLLLLNRVYRITREVYELAGSMDRSQRRWADAIHNLERACELDPRNFPYLINLGSTYLWLHDYDQHARIMDRIVALHPERRLERIFRASVEVYRRADTGPWRAAIEKILTNEPGSEKDPFVAEPALHSCFVRSRLGRR